MGIPGEEGPGVFTGTEFLNKANSGETVHSAGRWSWSAVAIRRSTRPVCRHGWNFDSAGMSRRTGRGCHYPLSQDTKGDAGHRARDR